MTKCIVKECKNTTQKNSGVTLHGFPNSLNAIKVWLIQTGNDFGDLDAFAQRVLESRSRWLYRMCSKHFSPQSYIWSGKKLVLKPDAVPTIFPGKVKNRYVTENLRGLPPSKRAQVEMQFQLHSIIKQHGGYHPTSLYVPPSSDPPHVTREQAQYKPGAKTTSTATTKVMVDKSTNTDPMFGKADKGVLWPEFEYNFDGEAWKIKHDHFYPYNRSSLRDSIKNAAAEAETEQDFWYTNDYETDKNSRHYHCRYPVGVRPYVSMEKDSMGDGAVPIKMGDVAVYFSRQEWEYIGQHRERYKDMLPEVEQPFSKSRLPRSSGADNLKETFAAKKVNLISPLNPNVVSTPDHSKQDMNSNSLSRALDSPEGRFTEGMLIREDGLYSSVSRDAPSLTGVIKEEAEEVSITDECLSAAEISALGYLSGSIKEEIEEITVTDSHLNTSQDPNTDSSDKLHSSSSWFNKFSKPTGLDEEAASASCWAGKDPSNHPKTKIVGTKRNWQALDSAAVRVKAEMLIPEDGICSSPTCSAPPLTGNIKEEVEEITITDEHASEERTVYRASDTEVKEEMSPQDDVDLSMDCLSDDADEEDEAMSEEKVKPPTPPVVPIVNIKEEFEEVTVTDSHLDSSPSHNTDSSDERLPSLSWFNKCYRPDYLADVDEDPNAPHWGGEDQSDDEPCISLSVTDNQSKERPHRCRACNECFPDKNQLAVHRRKHIAKSLRCPTCGKAFRFQSHLLKHQKTHKEENVYTCPICGVQYEQKVQFAAHMRVHPGEKPFKCDECGSCFAQKGSLVLHQKKHKGLDVYKCKLCGHRFDKKSKLKNHLKFHRLEKATIFS
uniref:Zinc finger protein 182 n=1 Tax=Xenopus tropicalis TaxID=8364 RepID=A0A6I8STS2_XENTR